jgi:hypothetical protein
MPNESRSVSKTKSRCRVRLGRNLEKNLLAYAAAAAAGLMSSSLSAEAEIIYTPSNTMIPTALANQGPTVVSLDLNNDGKPDFGFAMSSTVHFTYYGYTSRFKFTLKVVPTQASNQAVQGQLAATASAVSAGVQIGPKEKFAAGDLYLHASSYNGGIARYSGSWRKVEYAYVGLKFSIDGQIHYGWARIKFPYASGIKYPNIYGYAYESTPNQPIVAGQTSSSAPLASANVSASLGFLAAGASGLGVWRSGSR